MDGSAWTQRVWLARNLSVGLPAGSSAKASRVAFALAFAGLGIVGLLVGDFALVWQRIPIEHLPGRTFFAYAAAAVELLCGVGLLLASTSRLASRVLVVFLLLWVVLLKLPAVVLVPQMEATWLGFGEIAVMLAGAWVLLAGNAGEWEQRHLRFAIGDSGIRCARFLLLISLPMIGLSHFVYSKETAGYVPAWMPFPLGWAYLTGAGSLAACAGILFAFWPRLAATLEAAMLGIITLLVWGPGLFALPPDRTHWTAFLISSAIACGAWVVADSYRGVAWLSVGSRERA